MEKDKCFLHRRPGENSSMPRPPGKLVANVKGDQASPQNSLCLLPILQQIHASSIQRSESFLDAAMCADRVGVGMSLVPSAPNAGRGK